MDDMGSIWKSEKHHDLTFGCFVEPSLPSGVYGTQRGYLFQGELLLAVQSVVTIWNVHVQKKMRGTWKRNGPRCTTIMGNKHGINYLLVLALQVYDSTFFWIVHVQPFTSPIDPPIASALTSSSLAWVILPSNCSWFAGWWNWTKNALKMLETWKMMFMFVLIQGTSSFRHNSQISSEKLRQGVALCLVKWHQKNQNWEETKGPSRRVWDLLHVNAVNGICITKIAYNIYIFLHIAYKIIYISSPISRTVGDRNFQDLATYHVYLASWAVPPRTHIEVNRIPIESHTSDSCQLHGLSIAKIANKNGPFEMDEMDLISYLHWTIMWIARNSQIDHPQVDQLYHHLKSDQRPTQLKPSIQKVIFLST